MGAVRGQGRGRPTHAAANTRAYAYKSHPVPQTGDAPRSLPVDVVSVRRPLPIRERELPAGRPPAPQCKGRRWRHSGSVLDAAGGCRRLWLQLRCLKDSRGRCRRRRRLFLLRPPAAAAFTFSGPSATSPRPRPSVPERRPYSGPFAGPARSHG